MRFPTVETVSTEHVHCGACGRKFEEKDVGHIYVDSQGHLKVAHKDCIAEGTTRPFRITGGVAQ